jgi:hypothetical protein
MLPPAPFVDCRFFLHAMPLPPLSSEMPLMPRRRHLADCRRYAGDEIVAGAYAIIGATPCYFARRHYAADGFAFADCRRCAAIIFHAISD